MTIKVSKISKRRWNNKKGSGFSYFFTYVDFTGLLKTSGGYRTKVAAEIERAKIVHELENGLYMNIKKDITFKELSDIYIRDYAEVHLKPSTRDTYKNYLRNHLLPFFGALKVIEIMPAKINEFIRIKKQTTKLSSQTINKNVALMKTIFTYSFDNEIVSRNPAKNIRKLEEYKRLPNPLTAMEVNAILAVAKKHYPDFYPFLYTAISTGMRRGELLALTWDRINFIEGYLFVDRNVYNNQFCSPKTKTSIRRIDLPDELIKILKEWRLRCPNGELNLVFPNEEGKFQDPKNMKNRKYKQVLRRAGLDDRRFHDLRHTYATLLVSNQTNIQYVQKQMGHANISITMDTYAKMTQEIRERGINSINSVFSSSVENTDIKRFGT